MRIKFTGKFKELKGMGFKFHKLFANNYKVYEKNGIWIWVAHGGYIEIEDFYGKSAYIAKMILDDTYPKREKDSMFRGKVLFSKGEPKPIYMIKKNNELTGEYVTNLTFAERYEDDDYYEKYREVLIDQKWIDTLNEIRYMIELEM